MSEATATRNRRSAEEGETSEQETPAKEVVSLSIQMPPAMREALEAEATKSNLGLTQFARRALAGLVNFDVSVFERRTRSRVKYTNEEEAKAAKQAKSKERSALIRELMKKYQAGEIDVSLDSSDSN